MSIAGLCECGCGGRTTIARVSDKYAGTTRGQPRRFLQGHNNALRRVTYAEEDRGHVTPCWIWQGYLNEKGYGKGAGFMAHRKLYEDRYGPVPEGLTLDHLCRNRACVNPSHLESVTLAENCRRGAVARYGQREDVHPIARARVAVGLSQAQLAKAVGCSQALVSLWERGDPVSLRRRPQLLAILGDAWEGE